MSEDNDNASEKLMSLGLPGVLVSVDESRGKQEVEILIKHWDNWTWTWKRQERKLIHYCTHTHTH